jgi:hypothetical protein
MDDLAMTCLNCNREISEGGIAPASEISEAYKTTNTSTIKWCRCDTPKPARPCGSTHFHTAYDSCPGGGGFVVTQ